MILKPIAVLLWVGLVGCTLMAQEAPATPSEQPPATSQEPAQKEPGKERGFGRRGGYRGRGAHAGDWLRKYQNVPPDQQEQALANDPEFQKLSPERQGKLRQRLREFNAMTPEQRQRVLDRMGTFDRLTPEQQQRARALFARFRNLPEPRRRMMKRALRNLREMEPEQRGQVLGSEKFRSMFSADEMEVLKGMSELAPPPRLGPAPGNPSDRETGPPPTDRQ